jgi:heme oxygenase
MFEYVSDIHREVENLPFMQQLNAKNMTKEQYAQYLENLHPIYTTIEGSLLAHKESKYVKPLLFPDLFRLAALEEDLKFFGINIEEISPSKEAKKYATYIASLPPEKLLAHYYTRHLGDLAGGQILSPKIEELFEGGTSFYQFDALTATYSLESLRSFSGLYYKAELNKLATEGILTPEQQDDLVRETKTAFEYNGKVIGACECNPLPLIDGIKV